eukprot:427673_1
MSTKSTVDNDSNATNKCNPEKLLLFGYIRRADFIQHQLFPDSLTMLICTFYFQNIGKFLIIFESLHNKQDSFIKTCDISNQWEYLPSPQRKTNINFKNIFYKHHENSFCNIHSIPTKLIPGIDQTTIQNANNIASNVIYRVGGKISPHLSEQYIDIGCILDTQTIFKLPTLNTRRYGNRTLYSKTHGLITLGGCHMDISANYLSSIEQLCGDNNYTWNDMYIPNMIHPRFCPTVTLLDNGKYNEKLFVTGGKGDQITDLSKCEMYLFQHRKWIKIASMKYPRNSSGICEWKEKNGDVVVVGGYNGMAKKTVERYDLHKDRWYEMAKTNSIHKNCCCVTVYYDSNPYFKSNNGVLVVFGNDGTVANDWGCIEYYDDRDWTGKWNIIKRVDQCVLDTENTDFLWVLPTQ